jgi:phosphoglucosamine mutase
VLLGEDTRESSPWVTSYLAGGLQAAGVEPVSAGVLPTPGVAQLVRGSDFAAGVMISASHNPYHDNGIKLIATTGMKFPDATEAQIEERIHALLSAGVEPAEHASAVDMGLAHDYLKILRRVEPAEHASAVDMGLAHDYLKILRRAAPESLSGLHLVVDCGNGAATRVAPKLLRELGASVTAIHASPDGRNINRVVNGDGVLLAAARWMKSKGTLKGGAVVGTVMANLGLEVALRQSGLALVRAAVGDRYVLEEMQKRGANLGGEQSGHIIFLDEAPTGDGVLTALKVVAIIRGTGKSLEELTADLKVFPQTLRNIRVRERTALEDLPEVQKAVSEAESALAPPSAGQGARGRVVVRYSGTEPLLRVMVEAESEADVEKWTDRISTAIEAALGT